MVYLSAETRCTSNRYTIPLFRDRTVTKYRGALCAVFMGDCDELAAVVAPHRARAWCA